MAQKLVLLCNLVSFSICGCRIVVITSGCQSENGGSIPLTRSVNMFLLNRRIVMPHPSLRARFFSVSLFLSMVLWLLYLRENSLFFFVCALVATGFLALVMIIPPSSSDV